jgi:carbon starvation protein
VPAWKAIWPIFGATNQLLAGLAMLAVAVWLKKSGRKILFIFGPMVFMNVMTIWALILLLKQYRLSPIGLIAGILLLLALTLLAEAYKAVKKIIFA